jgi:hypothetical protein
MKNHDGSWSKSTFTKLEGQKFADENFIFRHTG